MIARPCLVLLLTVCCAPQPIASLHDHEIPPQPRAAIRVEQTQLDSITVIDPYRWMEHIESRELQAWAKGQNAHTRATLDRLAIRGALLAELQQLTASHAEARSSQVRPGVRFYLKRSAGEDAARLYVRLDGNEQERLLIDVSSLMPGAAASIDFYEPSPSGRYVAFGTSMNGTEDAVLRVVEVASATLLPDRIDRARHAEPRWRPDEASFFYRRNPKVRATDAAATKYLGSRDYLHVLGRAPDDDVAVFGYDVSPHVVLAPSDSPYVALWPGCDYVFGLAVHGTSNDVTIYVAPLDRVDGARTPWRKLADGDDQVLDLAVHGKSVFLRTHRDAPRAKVIRTSLDAPDLAHAATVIAPSPAVVADLAVAADALYVHLRDQGVGRITRVPFDLSAPKVLALPFDGTVGDLTSSPTVPGFSLQLQSWTHPRTYYRYDADADRFVHLPIPTAGPPSVPRLESIEVEARSKDGTMVPLSIVYRLGLDRSQPHPTLLSGYGSYGTSIDPTFDVRRLAWLARGGVYAVAHVRGGGERGEEWHLAGMKQHKHNTIDDFIACAELLIARGYTSPAQLAGEGASAGGITVGSAIVQRPDLFGAALIRVGITDALRFETTPLGPQNARELGSSAVPEEREPLYRMSPYYHVVDQTAYPAVLLTGAAHDARVPVWQPAKMAARLQAATSSGKPILLRLDADAGHGLDSTNSQRNEELADCYAFLFWQLARTPPLSVAPHR